MGNSNVLFESIFKRKLSDAGTREYLTEITNEYPFFAPAQFFLLLQAEKDTDFFQQQAAKASVLFNNPFWLQFQLQEKQPGTGDINDTIVDDEHFIPLEAEETVAPQTDKSTETRAGHEVPPIHDTEIKEIVEEADPTETNTALPASEMLPDRIAEIEIMPILAEPHLLHPDEVDEEVIPGNTIEPVNDISDLENVPAEINLEKQTEPLFSAIPPLTQPEKRKGRFAERETAVVNNENPSLTELPPHENALIDTVPSGHFNNESSPLVNEPGTEEDDELQDTDQEIEPLHFKLNIDTANITEDRIIFEPLHTSDYFASLGIKLSGEIKSSDRLGTHLKSFTEWLKTMKKIHNDQLPEQSGETDVTIQKLAEQSNKKAEVATEAMADVLLQQGKPGKAIEVYKKLSLLNPSKSAYFAAKIDQLKEH